MAGGKADRLSSCVTGNTHLPNGAAADAWKSLGAAKVTRRDRPPRVRLCRHRRMAQSAPRTAREIRMPRRLANLVPASAKHHRNDRKSLSGNGRAIPTWLRLVLNGSRACPVPGQMHARPRSARIAWLVNPDEQLAQADLRPRGDEKTSPKQGRRTSCRFARCFGLVSQLRLWDARRSLPSVESRCSVYWRQGAACLLAARSRHRRGHRSAHHGRADRGHAGARVAALNLNGLRAARQRLSGGLSIAEQAASAPARAARIVVEAAAGAGCQQRQCSKERKLVHGSLRAGKVRWELASRTLMRAKGRLRNHSSRPVKCKREGGVLPRERAQQVRR